MQAAHEAILALVTDSSLTSGVDYGFAYWAHGVQVFRAGTVTKQEQDLQPM